MAIVCCPSGVVVHGIVFLLMCHPSCDLQSAVDAGAISARAKLDAATKKAKELQAALAARGCVEDFTPDPELMSEGQVSGMQQ